MSEQPVHRNTLAAQEGLVIELVTGGGDDAGLAICFHPLPQHGTPEFVVDEERLLRSGYDVLVVHGADVESRIEHAAELVATRLDEFGAYRQIIAIGVQEGAVAALRICGPLNDVKVLAFSPILSASERDEPVGIQVTGSKVYLDRHSSSFVQDQVDLSAKFPGISINALPYSGSPAWFSAIETGVLDAELESGGSLTRGEIISRYRAGRTRSSLYLFNVGSAALSARKYRFATRALGYAFNVDPNPHVATLYARSVAEGGSPTKAIEILGPVVARNPANAHLLGMQAYFSELAKDDEKALNYIRRAIKVLPDYSDFLLYERRLLNRMYDDLDMRHNMTVMLLKKRNAEHALENQGPPEDTRPIAILAYIAAAMGIVVLVAVAARWANLL